MANATFFAEAPFIASKVGKTSLIDVTVDVVEHNPATSTDNTTFLVAQAATEVLHGLYRYYFTGDEDRLYTCIFQTADATVDQKELHALAVLLGRLGNLDIDVTSRLAPSVSGRTLDVTTGGEAGIDWSNIGTPTASNNFNSTTFYDITTKSNYALAASSIAASTFAASAIDTNAFALNSASKIWDAAVRTVTGGSVVATSGSIADTDGTTILLGRILGTLAAGTHSPQTGDSYPVVTNATYGNSAIHADIAIISGTAGAGSETVVITCNDGTNPIEGVAVWATTDIAGTDVKAGTLYSNASGIVTFYLDAGIYQVWKQGGANWVNPTQITVVDV